MNKISKKFLCLSTLMVSVIFGSSSQAFAWSSNESPTQMDTHKMIEEQAFYSLKNDLIENDTMKLNLLKLEENLSQLKKGAVAPDFGSVGVDRDYGLYQDHFYDPDTGKNFTDNAGYLFPLITDTAESQTRNYIGQAVAKWKDGNFSEATFILGKSLHYFADINEPHHASNTTGGEGTAHTKFENYAEQVKDKYKITTLGYNTSQGEYKPLSDQYLYLSDFITAQCNTYGRAAKALAPRSSLSSSWADWDYVADKTLTNAQKSTASVLYRFLKEVSYPSTSSDMQLPIGKFHVVLGTANEFQAGTNDYIYFGMQLEDGKTVEFECTLAGDDFEQNFRTAYELNITDPTFDPQNVKKVWIRKAKFGAGDDWKVNDIEVYMKGIRVFNKNINTWLSGNTTYNMDVNEL
ncbi:phospholipase C [Clostridium gasigenes]|uniref:phospholipase C n=1 Tax=Clostridium gasigenes TaxID=94869 RepID=UPI001C0B1F81|nr:phospholipase C [Clostridium gasigenes]MBU3108406.1 zinc dependent phospholipase C family protein [Clostridium gasigenes]